MTWQPGSGRIRQLLDTGELERVPPDPNLAQRLLVNDGRHLTTAAVGLSAGDLTGAYQLAYDALRKSAAALLAVQGLRATGRGHIALQDAVTAQSASSVGVFKAFSRIRRPRNTFEHSDSDDDGPSCDNVVDTLTIAAGARDATVMILDPNLLTPR